MPLELRLYRDSLYGDSDTPSGAVAGQYARWAGVQGRAPLSSRLLLRKDGF